MKSFKRINSKILIGLIILLFFLIFGCKNNVQSPLLPSPTASPSPSSTLVPSLTPTITSSNTVAPQPISTTNLIDVTDIPNIENSPTPIATPGRNVSNYQIKPWSENDALDLMSTLQDYSFTVNQPEPLYGRYGFQRAQMPIKVSAQEALLRFPNIQQKEDLEWRVALSNVILGNTNSDAWILGKMETVFNEQKLDMNGLNQYLAGHGFKLMGSIPVPGFISAEVKTNLLWISTLVDNGSALYFILSEDESQRYRVIPLDSNWNFNNADDETPVVEDYTGDGIPEIILPHGLHSGSECYSKVNIYQWQNYHLVDLGRSPGNPDGIFMDDCSQIDNSDIFKFPVIEIDSKTSSILPIRKYRWNGQYFEKFYEFKDSANEKGEYPLSSLITLIENGQYEEEYQSISNTIAHWSVNDDASFGSDYPDFLKFQMAMDKILEGEKDKAEEIFSQLISKPSNPKTQMISKAAQVFSDAYHKENTLFQACKASLKIMNSNIVNYQDYRDMIQVCDLRAIAHEIVRQIPLQDFEHAPDLLINAGVDIDRKLFMDVDNDGINEWILLINTPGDISPFDFWILKKSSKGIWFSPL